MANFKNKYKSESKWPLVLYKGRLVIVGHVALADKAPFVCRMT